MIAESKLSVVLGLGKSINEGTTCSISYPRTYALPGSICTDAISSDGVAPESVFCVDEYTPSLEPSSNDSFISENGEIEKWIGKLEKDRVMEYVQLVSDKLNTFKS